MSGRVSWLGGVKLEKRKGSDECCLPKKYDWTGVWASEVIRVEGGAVTWPKG